MTFLTLAVWLPIWQWSQTDPVKSHCGCRFSFQPSKNTPDSTYSINWIVFTQLICWIRCVLAWVEWKPAASGPLLDQFETTVILHLCLFNCWNVLFLSSCTWWYFYFFFDQPCIQSSSQRIQMQTFGDTADLIDFIKGNGQRICLFGTLEGRRGQEQAGMAETHLREIETAVVRTGQVMGWRGMTNPVLCQVCSLVLCNKNWC